MSHTPGPWSINPSSGAVMFQGRSRPRQLALVVGRLDGSECYEHDKALIAAAPELLAALRALSGIHGSTLLSKRLSLSNEMAQANAEAILAKLEGV